MRDACRAQGADPGRDAGVSSTLRGATGVRNAAGGGQIAFAGGGLMNSPGEAALIGAVSRFTARGWARDAGRRRKSFQTPRLRAGSEGLLGPRKRHGGAAHPPTPRVPLRDGVTTSSD